LCRWDSQSSAGSTFGSSSFTQFGEGIKKNIGKCSMISTCLVMGDPTLNHKIEFKKKIKKSPAIAIVIRIESGQQHKL